MKMLTFAKRNAKEILRDPLTLFFGLGFPLVLILLLSAIQANVPVPLFEIERLAPGISVFGLSFMTLFSATLVARDRETSFMERLYTTPLRGADFILGYLLPILPIAIGQAALCYLAALPLGLTPTPNILLAILGVLPISVFYVALGLLCGSLLGVKQVGGICGALLTNLSAWLSGVWFDLTLVGDVFCRIAECLPFFHAVEWERALLSGNFDALFSHLFVILLYGALTTAAAVLCFLWKMKRQ